MAIENSFKDACILIADDQDPIRKAMRRICQNAGVENVVETVDVADSIKALSTQQFHLILCDLYLRTKQGTKILEYVRNRDVLNDIPIIMISGEDARERIIMTVGEGASDFMVKPFQPLELEKKITNHLQKFFNPSAYDKILQIADSYLFKNDFENALSYYLQARKLQPQSAKIFQCIGLIYSKQKKYQEAEVELLQGLAISPNYYKIYRFLADQEIGRGQYPKAIAYLRKELEINPKQQMRQTLLANLLLSQSSPEGALEHLKIALQEDAGYYKGLMTAAKAYAMMGNLDKAVYYLLRARRSDPRSSEPLVAAMELFYKNDKASKIDMLLIQEKKSHPERLDTYLLLAQHMMRDKKFNEAEALLIEIIEKDKENLGALKLLNKIRQGRVQKAG